MVGVCGHEGVFRHPVEYRHIVRSECSYSSVAPFLEVRAKVAAEASEEHFGYAAVVVREPWVCLIVVIEVSIWFQNCVRSHLNRNRSTLQPG
ncbi:MAG: hypothetical protein NZ878_15435, partial [SAR324 cluster bacterium]|nr:hypothetical protein [SAR324 cluster bacterium]